MLDFREILDSLDDLVFVKGARSRLLWANAAFCRCYGLSPEQLRNLLDGAHADPDHTVQYVRDDAHVFRTGESLDIPCEPITRADGVVSYVHTVKTPILDEHGAARMIVGVSRPVRQAEATATGEREQQQIKSSATDVRSLVQQLPVAVALFDVHQHLLNCSENWRTLFAVREAVDGLTYQEAFGAQLPLGDAFSRAVDEGAVTQRAAVPLTRSGGEVRFVDLVVQPWTLPNGDRVGTIVECLDLTDRRRAEVDLREANDELIQFNYRLAHDFVAPLRTADGFAMLAAEAVAEGDAAHATELLDYIRQSIARLSDLSREIMQLARADGPSTSTEGVRLKDLIDDAVIEAQRRPGGSEVRVELELEVETVHTDPTRLRQVFTSLLANSVRFADPEQDDRWVRVRAADAPGGTRIQILDNGLGVDPALAGSIFELFSRATASHEGHGIGLYLVRKHLGRLGSSIALARAKDPTTFEFTLPGGDPVADR